MEPDIAVGARMRSWAAKRISLITRLTSGPEISVIVPIYNAERYLGECLESIQAQSVRSIEIICIDDGSADNSIAIVKAAQKRDSRIRLLRNARNLGAGASRNRGIAAARGRYIRFADADDILPPASLQTLYRLALETGSDVVAGAISIFSDDPLSPLRVDDPPDRRRITFADERDLWIPFWFSTYLFSAHLLRQNRVQFPNLIIAEDPVFLARALTAADNISLTSDCVYWYRKYPKAGGAGGRSASHLHDWLAHVRLIKSLFLERHPPAWTEVYGPFTKNLAASWRHWYLENPECDGAPTAPLTRILDAAVDEIWGSPLPEASHRLDDWWPRNWTRAR